ncbi:hypothetical protein HOU12_gp48 [Dickeya phage Katbat]|uniref:Uncharacterized protein n=3 Tax=Aarhusvirus TaxID=2732675 RepID=A0A2S1GSI5_9CAUD|nr:hypothetical protein HOT15_gp49 [Dickeya phage Dagda]YP_009811916.1 hypothetical protein HOU12_gp48 [Dickeya phage Katbat]AWD92354.1 hypothetical protein [Dickeya phage Dagda]AXY81653.1 hypothetical protein [Dickeya phage Dagda_B1]AXY81765.1 hypothetical protein [Dickeya phage Katbat]
MDNIRRTMFDAATSNVNGEYLPGFRAVKSGLIDIFFPNVQNGAVGFVLVDNTGKETEVIEGSDWVTPEGIKLEPMSPPQITDGHETMKVTTTGTVGLSRVYRVIKPWADNTDFGIQERVAALEEALNGSGGDSLTPGEAVPDPATGGSTTALTAPAAGSDAAAIVTWLGNMVTQFNSQRTTVGNARNALVALLKSLRDAGVIKS